MAEVQSLLSFNSDISVEITPDNSENTNVIQYRPLYNAVCEGDLDAVIKFLSDQPIAKTAVITLYGGYTVLHMAIIFRHSHIVKKLLDQFMSEDDVLVTNIIGSTLLHHTVVDERNNEISTWLIKKNNKLLTISDKYESTPFTLSIGCGNVEMARYLYRVTPFDALEGVQGATLLIQCYYFKMFDMALDLLKRCPRLALTPVVQGGPTFLERVATAPLNTLNESQPPYWKQWIYKLIHALQEPVSSINDDELPISISDTSSRMKYTHEAKHKQYLEIIHAACNAISPTNERDLGRAGVLLIIAAQHGNAELIVKVIKTEFSLLWIANERRRNIFHLSIEYRQAKVFNLIHGVIQKDERLAHLDDDDNNMLHMAGMLAPSTYLNQIPGAALQMQRELQWFKEVESIMPPLRRRDLNKANKTPRELFTERHMDLVKQGEKWMKGTATSCSVVAALGATITFAAAFTVPGGNNQNDGYPIFLHKKLFILFIISNAVSLFSSSTSLFMFLALLTSRYAEDDFLTSLPTKLIIGLLTMFISLATMMIAFCAALFLMIHDKTWIIIPVALLACVPVTLYIWLQLPLLVNMFKSTYMPSIFDRNVKPWP